MGLFRRRQTEAVVHSEEPARADVLEKGSFAFGTCPDCDWQGPGRRSRGLAESDATEHRERGCGV